MAAVIAGALALLAIPVGAAAQVSTTTTATFSGAVPEPGGADERYCGGAGRSSCASGPPVQVSWGFGGTGRSSLGFTPTGTTGLGEFSLGMLKHSNTVVGLYNGITAVDLHVNTTVQDEDRSVEFTATLPMRLGVHEVPDDLADCPYGRVNSKCADAVALPQPNVSFPFEAGNVAYRLEIIGFRHTDGTIAQHTVSPENGSTEVPLMARLTKTPRLDADAGPDQTVDEGSSVTLDGSRSRYADLTYAWRQVSGPAVTLDDPTAVRPTFPVGMVTEDQTLGFELTVRDRLEPAYVDRDTVQVTVRDLNDPPSAEADTGGDGYEVPEGGQVPLAGSVTDPDGNIATIEWDLDGDGAFDDGIGETPVFSAVGLDGPDDVTVALRVCDTFDVCAEDEAQVRILNVAPTVDLGDDLEVYRNDVVALSGTFDDPAGALDDPYTADWSGDAPLTRTTADAAYDVPVERELAYPLEGTYEVDLQVTDKDGGSGSDSLTVTVLNRAPSCAAASPTVASLWSPNHKPVPVGITGLTDAEGDALTVVVTGVRQDEPVREPGSGRTAPDASGVGTSTALLLAERAGGGDGRVYHVAFTVTDGHEGQCTGTVAVGVPHDQRGSAPVDQGALFDSTTTG
ncbi:PKD domain-containing protein [Geodermatophilus sp. SYSU D00814]